MFKMDPADSCRVANVSQRCGALRHVFGETTL